MNGNLKKSNVSNVRNNGRDSRGANGRNNTSTNVGNMQHHTNSKPSVGNGRNQLQPFTNASNDNNVRRNQQQPVGNGNVRNQKNNMIKRTNLPRECNLLEKKPPTNNVSRNNRKNVGLTPLQILEAPTESALNENVSNNSGDIFQYKNT